jgi:HK97 family phage prohead protease
MEHFNSGFEFKSLNTEDGTFHGYGSVFGNIDSHKDIVAKGAFKDTIAEAKSTGKWPAMLLQHATGPLTEDQLPIGIWTRMEEDETGLHLEGKLAVNTHRGHDLHVLMNMKPRPAINGLSIGYRPQHFVVHDKTSKARRTLHSVKLIEVSLVTSPSNALATVRGLNSVTKSSDDAAARFMHALAALAGS